MWEGFFTLLSFSVVMGVASFLAGSLPLSFGLSQNHARAIHAIGTGLLVGTCLIIIIPEGIDTLYEAAIPSEADLLSGSSEDTKRDGKNNKKEQTTFEPHAFVGIALIAGFITMYLIDRFPRHVPTLSSADAHHRPLHISLANLSQGPHRASSPSRFEEGRGGGGGAHDEDDDDDVPDGPAAQQSMATTIGLVIHAAADGIALAASSFIAQSTIGFIVFAALMIHKAPAAFGLTSVLLKQGFTKRQARAHLVIFSLAAPVGAFATWILVNVIAGGRIEGGANTEFWTGLLLLFSGGTFLYVAMHTMQESSGAEPHDAATNGYAGEGAYGGGGASRSGEQHKQPPNLRDTVLSVVGMLLPLLAQLGHAH